MRMGRGISQQVFDDTDGLLSGPLVLLLNYGNMHAGGNVLSLTVGHI